MAHILLAEDVSDARDLVIRFLQSGGHSVTATADGRLDLPLADARIDLFVCDLFMPEVDGLEAIQVFRRHLPNVPIIAISGGGFDGRLDVLPLARHLGADRVLAKPFSRRVLLDLIDDLLRRPSEH